VSDKVVNFIWEEAQQSSRGMVPRRELSISVGGGFIKFYGNFPPMGAKGRGWSHLPLD